VGSPTKSNTFIKFANAFGVCGVAIVVCYLVRFDLEHSQALPGELVDTPILRWAGTSVDVEADKPVLEQKSAYTSKQSGQVLRFPLPPP